MRTLILALFTVMNLGIVSVSATEYPLVKSSGPISQRDLSAVASFFGTGFLRYDFEMPRDFCFNVFIETRVKASDIEVKPTGHLCQLAGSHRLIVLWRQVNGAMKVDTHIHLRDGSQAGGTTGGIVPIKGVITHEARSPATTPVFSFDKRALVAEFDFTSTGVSNIDTGRASAVRTRVKVFLELRPNRGGNMSSGGRHI